MRPTVSLPINTNAITVHCAGSLCDDTGKTRLDDVTNIRLKQFVKSFSEVRVRLGVAVQCNTHPAFIDPHSLQPAGPQYYRYIQYGAVACVEARRFFFGF